MSATRLFRTATCFAILGFATSVSASPMTFNFVTSGWGVNLAPAIFGTGLNLSITVDNGSSATASQSYQFTQITALSASAIGGTFTFFASNPPNPPNATANPTLPPIYTDAFGVPTLDLLARPGTGVWFNDANDNTNKYLQIGVLSSGGGPTTLYADQHAGTNTYAYLNGPVGSNQLAGILIRGVNASQVPEPSTLSLLTLALVPLGLAYRKTRNPA